MTNNICNEKIKNQLNKKLNVYYIFLGEDIFFIQKKENIIFQLAHKKGFIKKNIIDIKKITDWDKIVNIYKIQDLFEKKSILIINCYMKMNDLLLINKMNYISRWFNKNILVIIKLYKLSSVFLKKKNISKLNILGKMISCFTPKKYHFFNWIKHEIKEKNIHIEKQAYLLLCKNYEGNTLFVSQILNIILLVWPNEYITIAQIKKIINNFSNFSPLEWINSIFNRNFEQAIYILNNFFLRKYNPLILIRCLQNDILTLLHMKKEKKINLNNFLKKQPFLTTRYEYFINAYKYIHIHQLIKSIKILIQIEIKIKKEYNHNIWINLKTLTLLLST